MCLVPLQTCQRYIWNPWGNEQPSGGEGGPPQGRKHQEWDPSVPCPCGMPQVLALLSYGTPAGLCPTGWG